MGLLAGAVSHDLRNVFNAVAYTSKYIRESFIQSDHEHFSDALDGFDQALVHGRSLLKRLSGISAKNRAEKIGPVDVIDVVRLVIKSYQSRPMTCPIVEQFEHEPALALANSDMLIRILFNLCENAISATEGVEGGLIRIRLSQAEGCVALQVEDNGCGMTEELQSRIFEPYFTTKPDGTGLGLCSVQQMVQGLAGKLDVRSTLGEGTRIQILLPRAGEGRLDEQILRQGYSVLVVDDDELACRLHATALTRIGCSFESRTSPLDAIELLKKQKFDFLMTDYGMHPIDGVELVIQARRLQPGIRTILVTGYADILSEQGRLASGEFSSILAKPLDSAKLIPALTGQKGQC